MIRIALWILSFVAGGAALLAVGKGLRLTLERHPDLVAEHREGRGKVPWPLRSWHLAIRLAARELPGTRLEKLRRRVADDLLRSAAPAEVTAEVFLGQAILEGVGLGVIVAVLFFALAGRPYLLLALAVAAVYSLGIRPQMLRARAQQRVGEINRRLAYAIDLAVLVLGAGGTLREALAMIAEAADRDPLAQEIATALAQIRAGTPQAKALLDMANRVQLEDLSTLVIAINRGEETGAPMARALATQAEIFRFRRMQRAERVAVEAPVKMMFPNLIIMLAVLLIVLGPVFIDLIVGGGMF